MPTGPGALRAQGRSVADEAGAMEPSGRQGRARARRLGAPGLGELGDEGTRGQREAFGAAVGPQGRAGGRRAKSPTAPPDRNTGPRGAARGEGQRVLLG